jgi:tRNA(Arg) A34 adenosine deaminase TadA
MKARQYLIAKCYDKKGRLLSVGFNSYTKTHPIQRYFARKVGHAKKEYLHAEIAAIIRAKDKLIHKITIERYDRHGNPACAKPCKICQEAIQAYGIHQIEYTYKENP